jgi:serine/threonine protein kinase
MIGGTILHYKIIEKLGEGGMGEVYKAQDTKLDRFVALKFLPSQLTATEEDKARFIQEAKAASAMNHPNVCTIYSIEEYNSQLFISMEYVEGKTLKDKKDHLSEKQILEIGIQVAEGLAAAHEKGIVHRDIKPENIMIRKDGIVQIMDFGLAKLYKEGNVSRLTKAGSTVGTMGYMSPEQIQGLDVDHRTDIFSLGVVLYELLAGESPFKGMHETAVMYEIVNVNPEPVSSLKPEVNSEIDPIIFECLEKDPTERYQSAAEIARNLRRVKRDSGKSRITRASVINKTQLSELDKVRERGKSSGGSTKHKIILTVSFLLVAVLAAMISWLLHPEPVKQVRKFQWSAEYANFIISPDGKKIAYTKDDKIWIRFLDKTDPVEININENVSAIFWSPGSDYVAYFSGAGVTNNHELRKVSISGVGNVLITQTGSNYWPRFWGIDDSIIVTSWDNQGLNTLLKVPSLGGELKPMYGGDSSLSKINGNLSHIIEIPDRKSLIISINYQGGKNKIVLQTDEQRIDLYSNSGEGFIDRPVYSNEGYILFTLYSHYGSDIWAIPFDAASLERTGNNFLVARNASEPSVSENGILTYRSYESMDKREQLVLLSRSGQLLKNFNLSATDIYSPAVSPDGNKIACTISNINGEFNIWIYDMIKGTKSQLTYDIPNSLPQSFCPTWSPDGKKIVFANAFDNTDIYEQEINSSAPPRPFIQTDKSSERNPFWSRDGKFILFSRQGQAKSGYGLWYLEVDKNDQTKKLIESESDEDLPSMSPDGRFVAFQSDKSGQIEIWVTNFPKADKLWQVSFNGGNYPHWVGDEIFFINPRLKDLMVVKVKAGPEFETPNKLFSMDTTGVLLQNVNYFKYAVTNDGKNVVTVKNLTGSTGNKYVLVENWSEEFKDKEK